jgi:hypothetical protein
LEGLKAIKNLKAQVRQCYFRWFRLLVVVLAQKSEYERSRPSKMMASQDSSDYQMFQSWHGSFSGWGNQIVQKIRKEPEKPEKPDDLEGPE